MFNKIVSKNQDTTLKGRSHQHLGYRKGMSIASLNVNSLRRHYDEIKLLLKNLGIHVLALNETKLDPEYPKELTTISGYQQERRDRTGRGEVFLSILETPLTIYDATIFQIISLS